MLWYCHKDSLKVFRLGDIIVLVYNSVKRFYRKVASVRRVIIKKS